MEQYQQQSVNDTPSAALSADFDEFSDLGALLEASLKEKADAEDIKRQRKSLGRKDISREQWSEANAKVKEWDNARDWDVKADVVVLEEQQCSHCGAKHTHFTGRFIRQRSRQYHIDRWIERTEDLAKGLPKEIKRTSTLTDMCCDCMPMFGYAVEA